MTPWDDPNVRRALKDGLQPSDISLICCPRCGVYGYYNDGSHFTCRDDQCGYSAGDQELDALIDMGEVTDLDEYSDIEMDMGDVP